MGNSPSTHGPFAVTRALGASAKSIREIGRELGAEFLVEGSVQAGGAQPSVTFRIVEAATDRTVFSQTFRTEAGDFESPLARQQLQAWTMAIEIYRRVKAERPPTAAAQERMEKIVTAVERESDEREVRLLRGECEFNSHAMARSRRMTMRKPKLLASCANSFFTLR